MTQRAAQLAITNHAIMRWQQRIEDVPEQRAVEEMLMALATAKPKHCKPARLKKRTFYIPTVRALFVGSKGKIVSVLEPRGDNAEGAPVTNARNDK